MRACLCACVHVFVNPTVRLYASSVVIFVVAAAAVVAAADAAAFPGCQLISSISRIFGTTFHGGVLTSTAPALGLHRLGHVRVLSLSCLQHARVGV